MIAVGQDITTTLQYAYQHATQLLKLQRYLEKLQHVEAGDYWQYGWQKTPKRITFTLQQTVI